MTKPKPLVGFIGCKRSGKETAARPLIQRHGYRHAAYADPLREFLAASNPIVGHELDGPYKVRPVHWNEALDALGYELAKDRYPEFRRIMEKVGTEGVRDKLGVDWGLEELLGLSPWVAIADLRLEKAKAYAEWKHEPGRWVHHWRELLAFADVRFPNEADLIRDRGGILIRVTRASLPPLPPDAHLSETALVDYRADYTLANDGSIDDLNAAVDALISKL